MITSLNIDSDITVGRLCNKLFIIAACYAANKELNTSFAIPAWKYQKYFPNIPTKDFKGLNCSTWREPNFRYTKLPVSYPSDILHIHGRLQSEKYFKKYENDIKVLVTPCKEILDIIDKFMVQLSGKTVTSVHVRRGDYLSKSQYHPPCSLDYYRNAMSEIPSDKYLVFSDDIPWCKENIKGDNIMYSSNNEVLDLFLMSKCTHNIIANSSFSWWGAWLNENKNKKIIYPKAWFGNCARIDTSDLIPNEWRQNG